MKTIIYYYSILFGVVISLSACSSTPPKQSSAIQPVGPAPGKQASPANHGFLVVYSGLARFGSYYESPLDRHSSYNIYSQEGKRIQWVRNYTYNAPEVPDQVDLPVGTYKLGVLSMRGRTLTIPVVIKEGQTTIVFLDGVTKSGTLLEHQADAVRLPDGEIVGWSANIAQK